MSTNSKTLKTDVVVIGGGGAGLAAASAAAEKGARVVVLEKRGALGGNSALAWGIFAAESPAQKRAMIDCRRDDCFKLAMDFARWKVNPRLVRALIDKSGDTIRWLEEKGLQFEIAQLYPNQIPTWHIPTGRGAALIKALSKNCRAMGVQLLTDAPASKIQTAPTGEITSVVVKTKEAVLNITARGVIVSTGGYGGNKELLKKYCAAYHESMEHVGLPHMGDGLMMTTEIGAATEGLGMLMMAGPTCPDTVSLKVGTPPNQIRFHLMALALEPYSMWVNKRGQRFVDEAFGYYHYECSHSVARQPDRVSFTLYDAKMIQRMTDEGLILAMGLPEGAQGNKLPGLEKEISKFVKKGAVSKSESLKSIAEWIGSDPAVLQATVDEYNDACDRGYDPLFVKDRNYLVPLRTPPFYAIRCGLAYINTIGGIKINEHMEVLTQKEDPIPGLYAAGVDTGGWESDTYFDRLSGHAFGFAVNAGRIAGENAAAFVAV